MPSTPDPAIFASLNREQAEVVKHLRGGLLVMAPVGTGKTTVIARRAAHAIASGIEPGRILCLSFTNKAAREMQARISELLGDQARGLTTSTFHALCADILRHESDALGISYDFTIYDEEDCKEIVTSIAHELGLKPVARPRSEESLEVRVEDVYNWIQSLKLARCAGAGFLQSYGATTPPLHSAPPRHRDLLILYQKQLHSNHGLDFADLISLVCDLFVKEPLILERWQNRYDWIQVDEVQDTSVEEYFVIQLLAARARNLAFFGDFDQTIYEWRGSAPGAILAHFRDQFGPLKEVRLNTNYRSTGNILRACEGVISNYSRRATGAIQTVNPDAEEKVRLHKAESLHKEGLWVGRCISQLRERNPQLSYRDIVVLTRTNALCTAISETLQANGIPSFLVDQYKFFRRAEIKDALAFLRLVLQPADSNSAWRILHIASSPCRLSDRNRQLVRESQAATGLRIADLLQARTFAGRDPFGLLLQGLDEDRVVVFDLETTGQDPSRDAIVEIGAVRMGRNGERNSFQALIKPDVPVGESIKVQGLSDDFLQRNGAEVKDVLKAFDDFCDGALLVGHNVAFDMAFLTSWRQRCHLPPYAAVETYDTLDLARRFLNLSAYKLETIHKELNLSIRPAHRALDDARCTAELLGHLVPLIEERAEERRKTVAAVQKELAPLAMRFEAWRKDAENHRPAKLLEKILAEANIIQFWQNKGETRRLAHLEELVDIFAGFDDQALPPRQSLLQILNKEPLAVMPTATSRPPTGWRCSPSTRPKGWSSTQFLSAGRPKGCSHLTRALPRTAWRRNTASSMWP